jgi:hypothetical protein
MLVLHFIKRVEGVQILETNYWLKMALKMCLVFLTNERPSAY